MNELSTVNENSLSVNTVRDLAVHYLNVMGLAKNLNQVEKEMFLQLCEAYQLNPYKKEIYGIKYGNKFDIIIAYEVYLQRAERTGLLDGWEVSYNREESTATCVVYRKDMKHPIKITVEHSEYRQNSPIWQSKPRTMLEKVALAQAMRRAFPNDCGKLPMIKEEMQNSVVIDMADDYESKDVPQEPKTIIKPTPVTKPTPPPIKPNQSPIDNAVQAEIVMENAVKEEPLETVVNIEDLKDKASNLILKFSQKQADDRKLEERYNNALNDSGEMIILIRNMETELSLKATKNQIDDIMKLSKEKNITPEVAKKDLKEMFGVNSSSALSKIQAEQLIEKWSE